ncbi:hypothetical protein J7M28_12735 [bacterium]|nr:hypothetical protein [bacterium]
MKVQIEGKTIDASRGKLRQMAVKGKIQPWYQIKCDELTQGKWVKSGQLPLFEGIWDDEPAPRRGPVRTNAQPWRESRDDAKRQQRVVEAAAGRAKTSGAVVASSSFELYGFRIDYKLKCPKCTNQLTQLGVSECPRCGARLALSRPFFWLKKVAIPLLFGLGYAAKALFETIFDDFADLFKFVVPAAVAVVAVLSIFGRGAKILLQVSVDGHKLPEKKMLIALPEYYSSQADKKIQERIKSAFNLNPMLKKLKESRAQDSSESTKPLDVSKILPKGGGFGA